MIRRRNALAWGVVTILPCSAPAYAAAEDRLEQNSTDTTTTALSRFLPPLAPQTGTEHQWSMDHDPQVNLCIWTGSRCRKRIATFHSDSRYFLGRVHRRGRSNHFMVYWWSLGILRWHRLEEGESYRLRVLLDGQEIGHQDVRFVPWFLPKRRWPQDDTMPTFRAGRIIPIRFQIATVAVDETTEDIRLPQKLAGGGFHNCHLDAEQRAQCWGYNQLGELGAGYFPSLEESATPVPLTVQTTEQFSQIVGGDFHTCALDLEQRAWCWGYNVHGQLGIGSVDNIDPLGRAEPHLVLGGLPFTMLSAGRFHTCGITVTDEAYCWGSGGQGQLGDGQDTLDGDYISSTPTRVAHHTGFRDIAAGVYHTCGVDLNGQLYCWGNDDDSEPGIGVLNQLYNAPHHIDTGTTTFRRVSSRFRHACALSVDGGLYCWGNNKDGQLGDGTTMGHSTPAPIISEESFESVSTGFFHSCARASSGSSYCWGSNRYGQVGDGVALAESASAQSLPTLVHTPGNLDELHCGAQHTCGRIGTQTYCWGFDLFGQLGRGAALTDAPYGSALPLPVTAPTVP